MSRRQLGWLVGGGHVVWGSLVVCGCLVVLAGGQAKARGPGGAAGLMVHVPFDGSFTDARALGAVRPEAEGNPKFVDGVKGKAAIPQSGHGHIGRLHVSRLSKLALLGRTPAAGTIMLWYRQLPADADGSASDGDSAAVVLLTSDHPLNLSVGITGAPSRLAAAFDDDAGVTHRIEAPLALAQPELWHHLALAWDSEKGRIIAFVQGEQVGETTGAAFRMPGLPKTFELGAREVALDEFRLYKNRLDLSALRAAAGL